ncbi:twin-arginine translocase subunit TatC [Candidatus Poribacteria bacterium]|nr:twin-arginine translocase subunit TatC [Candidatus Poribacteria bacterium]
MSGYIIFFWWQELEIVKDTSKTFLEHLDELRKRIIVSVIAAAAGTIISFIFRDWLFDFKSGLLTLPLRTKPSDLIAGFFNGISKAGIGTNILNLFELFFRSRTYQTDTIKLFAAAPTEKFLVAFKGSFTVGMLLAAPIILYEVWAFILPALKSNERRYLVPLFVIAVSFFIVGAVFAFFVVTPVAMPVLSGLMPSIENQWRIEYYFSFVIRIMLAFGLAFELPMVMGFISWIGIFDAEGFKRQRKLAVILIFVASAALTPQDPFTMLLMAIPLMGLYELGIRFAIAIGQRNARMLSSET